MFDSRTLGGLLDELADSQPQHAALSDAYTNLNFAEVRWKARDVAKALHGQGVRPGDRVGLLMPNVSEWIVTAFGIQYVGATVVAISTWYTAPELQYVLEHSGLVLLVTIDRFLKHDYVDCLDSLKPLEQSAPDLRQVVVLGQHINDDMMSYDEFLDAGQSVNDATVDALSAKVSPDDTAYLLYTSGSTSTPKGVPLCHRHLIENTFNIGERQRLSSNDTLLLTISLFWGFGCSNALVAAWTHGMHIVLQKRFDPEEAMQLIEKHRCTTFYATPNITKAMLLHSKRDQHDLSSLSKGLHFGPPGQIREVIETLIPNACTLYGFTEGYGNSLVTNADDSIELRANSIGYALPGSTVDIVDPESDQTRNTGDIGEIRVKGYVMKNYFNDPGKTADAFDANNRFKTGDLAYKDSEGYVYFKGRIKEIIKTGGMNLSPAEVEEVLRAHALIDEAFVIGLPDSTLDEVIAAVIVQSPSSALTTEEVIEHCKQSLAAYKIPKHVCFVDADALPLTGTGKVHKNRLAELFNPGR